MLAGRLQNLLTLRLRIGPDSERPVFLQVSWSIPPKRNPSHEAEKPHCSDCWMPLENQNSFRASWKAGSTGRRHGMTLG